MLLRLVILDSLVRSVCAEKVYPLQVCKPSEPNCCIMWYCNCVIKSAFVFLLALCYCCRIHTNAWGYSEEGSYRAKRPNVTMEEYCPGWGRPADWHIPPRTPRPGCCKWGPANTKYFEYLCFKYGWIPPKGWKNPGPVKKPGLWRGPHAHIHDDYYYDEYY